jgi:hypothetical protein
VELFSAWLEDIMRAADSGAISVQYKPRKPAEITGNNLL